MRINKRMIWLAGAMLLGVSCDHDEYQILMTPKGEGLERELTAWRAVSREGGAAEVQIAPDKLQRLAGIYPRRASTQPGGPRQTFVGTFKGKLPADINGAGECKVFRTSMGSAAVYLERFAGTDEVAARLAQALTSADALTDILAGWLAPAAGKDPRLARLREFLDKDFRKDARNVVVYLWCAGSGVVSAEQNEQEIVARAVQYLMERDYFSFEDAPEITRLVLDQTIVPDEKIRRALVMARKLLAGKMGLASVDLMPRSLDFLSDPEKTKASLLEYLKTTDAYRRRAEQWKRDLAASQAKPPGTKAATTAPASRPAPPDPWSVMEEATKGLELGGFIHINLFDGPGGDLVKVSLRLAQEPLNTSGQWNEERSSIDWDFVNNESRLSKICYAIWVEPDAKFQVAHFGKVVLNRESLGFYCLWRKSLTQAEGSQWDGLIASLRPGPAAYERLKAFRFSHEPQSRPATGPAATQPSEPRSYSQEGVRVILDGLEGEPTTRPAPRESGSSGCGRTSGTQSRWSTAEPLRSMAPSSNYDPLRPPYEDQ